ncbi:MAG: hypothetical protein JWQ97_484, partial [Phenylobacterium sp.]|nr:hypothetical protein [Phenylobacterium sp.]
MSAIATQYPEDVQAATEGVEAFLRREVFPRHEKHESLLSDSSRKYAGGIYSKEASEIIREVRLAAAEAGFYAMCAPEDIGGGGLGLLAYFAAWERIYHLCGAKYWLGHHMISHWAKGPSPVIGRLSPQGRAKYLPRIMSGEDTLCFGLS